MDAMSIFFCYYRLHFRLKQCFVGQENLEDRLLSIRNVVQALPRSNFDILRRVSEHLDKYARLLSDFRLY